MTKRVVKVSEKSRANLTGGSRKGIPNKVTGDVKAMVLAALEGAGGVAYLQRQAGENPAAFMTLLGKVLPLQVSGANGEALVIELVRFGEK